MVAGGVAGGVSGAALAAEIVDFYRWHNPSEVVSDLQLEGFRAFCRPLKGQSQVKYLLLGRSVLPRSPSCSPSGRPRPPGGPGPPGRHRRGLRNVGSRETLVVDGRPVTGATGAASEFGHLPCGDRRTRCQCGARGCWQTVLGVRALAATMGEPEPEPETVDPREFAHHVLALAAEDSRAGERAAEVVAESSAVLGAGLAGLVNALDPDVVTIAGLAIALRTAAPSAFEQAYLDGLMAFRRASPPPVRDSPLLGDDGALLGAAAVGLEVVVAPESLAAWAER